MSFCSQFQTFSKTFQKNFRNLLWRLIVHRAIRILMNLTDSLNLLHKAFTASVSNLENIKVMQTKICTYNYCTETSFDESSMPNVRILNNCIEIHENNNIAVCLLLVSWTLSRIKEEEAFNCKFSNRSNRWRIYSTFNILYKHTNRRQQHYLGCLRWVDLWQDNTVIT